MRMLLKAIIDTEAANEVFRTGRVAENLGRIIELLKPEAVYFAGEDGQRAVFAVFDLADPSQLPVVSEPLYLLAKAKITVTPCMNLEELKKGLDEAARQMPVATPPVA
jgi:hypothetical protein